MLLERVICLLQDPLVEFREIESWLGRHRLCVDAVAHFDVCVAG